MKMIIYTTKDEDNIFGMLAYSSHRHFIAEQIKEFFKKVGQFKPVKWFILGTYDTMTGKIETLETPEEFDWEKQLADDMTKDTGDAIETSSVAKEVESNE